jgi:hypothetical protein
MGQAKERKARLGKWYGRPIGPGHPDFVPPKKPEPIRPLLRFDAFPLLGMVFDVILVKIHHFNMYGNRIEVEFVDGKREWFWPAVEGEKIHGRLTIGSVEFGDVELVRYTETGCVFLRSQSVQEEPSESEPTEGPSDEQRTQEEPTERPRRTSGYGPIGRRLPALFSLAMIAASAMSFPEPEHRPRKR